MSLSTHKRRNLPPWTFFVAWLLIVTLTPGARSQGLASFPVVADDDAPLKIEVSPKVDEELFLVRALESLYEQWPIPDEFGPDSLRAEIAALRRDAARHAEHARAHRLDGTITELYENLISMLDTYDSTITGILRVDREIDAQAKQDKGKAMINSGAMGATVGTGGYGSGMSGGSALILGAGASFLAYVVDMWSKSGQLDEAKKAAVEQLIRDHDNKYRRTFAHAQSASAALAKRKDWEVAEVGFDVSEDQALQILELLIQEDYRELTRLRELTVRKRPRDPFAQTSHAFTAALASGDAAKPGELMRLSDECFEAASFVPEGRFYDEYRAQFVGLAALIANEAVKLELGKGQWTAAATAPPPSGPRGVRLWRTYLALDEADASGEGRMELAWALARAGRHADALEMALQVSRLQNDNPDYAYNLACLYSLNARPDEAFKALEHAIEECGFFDIATARSDPDLAILRSRKQVSFGSLTAAKFDWEIDWGLLSDDILLTNKSSFPWTNVTFIVYVNSTGYKEWTGRFTTDVILPGETQRWNTRITSRGNDFRTSEYLYTDQSR